MEDRGSFNRYNFFEIIVGRFELLNFIVLFADSVYSHVCSHANNEIKMLDISVTPSNRVP